MPNNITTELSFKRRKSEILEFLRGKEKDTDGEYPLIDFNNIFPMPKELIRTSPFRAENGETQEEAWRLQQRLIKEYGADTWYEWRTENWGTKWNAYDYTLYNDNTIRFDTAWGHPFPIIEKLSTLFSNVTFTVKFADEDMGCNCGYYKIKNGVTKGESDFEFGSEEALAFACEVKGYDYDEYMIMMNI